MLNSRNITASLTGLMLVLGGAVSFGTVLDTKPMRTWSDDTGSYEVVAELLSVDTKSEMATLRLADGETVDVPFDRLSRADRRFVEQHVVRRSAHKNAASKGVADKGTTLSVSSKNEKPLTVKKRTGKDGAGKNGAGKNGTGKNGTEAQPLFGLQWHDDFESAAKVAKNSSETTEDDKPIFCFRVLGQLDGFM